MLTSKNAELEKGNSIATDDMTFDTDSQIGSAAAEARQLQSDIELMDQQAKMFLSNATLVQEAVDKGPWNMEVKVRELMEKITKSLQGCLDDGGGGYVLFGSSFPVVSKPI